MIRQIGCVVLGVAFAVSAAGCLVVSGKDYEEHGVKLSDQTLSQIEPGKTTKAWLVAALGEPTSCAPVAGCDNVEVLRYTHTICRDEGGAVFLIFAGGTHEKKTTTAYFEVTDGIVTRYWTES